MNSNLDKVLQTRRKLNKKSPKNYLCLSGKEKNGHKFRTRKTLRDAKNGPEKEFERREER